jgi:DNA polymerase IV
MDAFFASVEVLDDPSLEGKPVLVGGNGPRGVVAAASYEARKFGCHSAQPMVIARRLCPQAVIVKPHFHRYREMSDRVFEIFERFTPVIEPLSVDEAFLDLTGTEKLHGDAIAVARKIKQTVFAETKLTASVGVAGNKFLAKIASDMNKPDGLMVIGAEDVERMLSPMPVGKMWGIGPKTAKRLEGFAVRTIGDLRTKSAQWLNSVAGVDGEHYLKLAHGEDDRAVTPDRAAKSIGQEQTFGVDVNEPDEIRAVMLEQSEQVARRLRKHKLLAGSVSVKIRFGDFQTITRQCTLEPASDSTRSIWDASRGLFDTWCANSFAPVRLIGVQAGKLCSAQQMELFADPAKEKERKLETTLDRIHAKFGEKGIRRAMGAADE